MSISSRYSNSCRHLLRRVRRSAQAALHGAGANHALSSTGWRQAHLLILCYHGVSLEDEHLWDPGLFVTPEFLRRRFEQIQTSGYNVIPLDSAVRQLAEGSLPPKSVVLTFDDGFYNFHAGVMPLLETFGFPATVYVPSYHVLNQRPIPLLAARFMAWRALRKTPLGATWKGRVISAGDLVEGGWALEEMSRAVQTYREDHVAQVHWLEDLAGDLMLDWSSFMKARLFHLMTEDEIRDVSRRGVAVELHTHRHRTPRNRELFLQEIEENLAHLQAMTGRRAEHFCYPSGDFDPMFFPILRECGVRSATTCETGIANAKSEPMLLPRFIDTMAQPEATFHCWLSGLAAFVR